MHTPTHLTCGPFSLLSCYHCPVLGDCLPSRVQWCPLACVATLAFHSHFLSDANEAEIGDKGGLEAILAAAAVGDNELKGQAARALRNLSVRGVCVRVCLCVPPCLRCLCMGCVRALMCALTYLFCVTIVRRTTHAHAHIHTHAHTHTHVHTHARTHTYIHTHVHLSEENKAIIRRCDGVSTLLKLAKSTNEKIKQQATRALMNLGETVV